MVKGIFKGCLLVGAGVLGCIFLWLPALLSDNVKYEPVKERTMTTTWKRDGLLLFVSYIAQLQAKTWQECTSNPTITNPQYSKLIKTGQTVSLSTTSLITTGCNVIKLMSAHYNLSIMRRTGEPVTRRTFSRLIAFRSDWTSGQEIRCNFCWPAAVMFVCVCVLSLLPRDPPNLTPHIPALWYHYHQLVTTKHCQLDILMHTALNNMHTY